MRTGLKMFTSMALQLVAAASGMVAEGATIDPMASILLESGLNDFGHDGTSGDRFGTSVSVDGDTAIVVAEGDNSIYVFNHSAALWELADKIKPSVPRTTISSAAVSGDSLVLGLRSTSGPVSEVAEVHVRSGGKWVLDSVIRLSSPCANGCGRSTVAISTEFLAVGLPEQALQAPDGNSHGLTYLFHRDGSEWHQSQLLRGFVGGGSFVNGFGQAIALRDDALLVTSPREQEGRARLYDLNQGLWSLKQILVPSAGTANFGASASMQQGSLLVGATKTDGCDSYGGCDRGSALLFEYGPDTDQWSEVLDFASIFTGNPGSPGTLPSGANFGRSVVLAGDMAIVGAPQYKSGSMPRGAVFVFRRSPAGWSYSSTISAADGNASSVSDFALGIAATSDTVLVGLPRDDYDANQTIQGAAVVFRASAEGPDFVFESRLTSGRGSSMDWFGASVAVDDAVAVVGAPGETVDGRIRQGTAYVFQRVGGTWAKADRLVAADGAALESFGATVAVDGDILAIGAPAAWYGLNEQQGIVRIFQKAAGTWAQQQALVIAGGHAGDKFGTAIALHDGRLVVGAPGVDSPGGTDQGAAYVFEEDAGQWVLTQTIFPSYSNSDAAFGRAVSLSEHYIAVGQPGGTGGSAKGAVFVYANAGGSWMEESILRPPPDQLADAGPCGAHIAAFADTVATTCGNGVWGGTYARVYRKSPMGTWYQEQRIDLALVAAYYNFPGDVAMADNTLVVDIQYSTGALASPRLALFERVNGNWSLAQHVPFLGEHERMPIALDGTQLLVGHPDEPASALYGNPGSGFAELFNVQGESIFADGFD